MYAGISSGCGRTSSPCGRTEIRKEEVLVDVQGTEKGKSLTGSVCRHSFSYWSVSLQLRLQVFCLYVFCAHFWDPLVCLISRDEGNKCQAIFFFFSTRPFLEGQSTEDSNMGPDALMVREFTVGAGQRAPDTPGEFS
jgi:hypothetical protein